MFLKTTNNVSHKIPETILERFLSKKIYPQTVTGIHVHLRAARLRLGSVTGVQEGPIPKPEFVTPCVSTNQKVFPRKKWPLERSLCKNMASYLLTDNSLVAC